MGFLLKDKNERFHQDVKEMESRYSSRYDEK